jgi:regulator of nucleoside diphosphate kinase
MFIKAAEFGRLEAFAEMFATSGATLLREELGRARIIHAETRPGFAHLNSMVTYLDRDTGKIHTVELVLPDEDCGEDRVSILSPLGAALIGLGEGAEFRWKSPSGEILHVKVFGVGRRDEAAPGGIRYYRQPPMWTNSESPK